MRTWNALLAAGFTGSLLAAYSPAGVARVDIDVDIAPPPLAVESAPPREGYIYAPGYWEWSDEHHYVWKKGEYVKNRPGHHWVPHAWEKRNGRYHFNEGHWERGDHGS